MSEHHGKDWEKIWFMVMMLLVAIFVGISYYSIVTGSSATYRYGLPLGSGLPHPLPNGTVVIYMLAVQWAFIPQNATEIIYVNGHMENISVTAQVITYANGYPYLKVMPGQPVVIVLYSNNVDHGFYIRLPHGAQNWNIVPGVNSYAFFYAPTTPGNYTFYCSEYCGVGHAYMYGYLWVM